MPEVFDHVAPLIEPLGAHRASELLALVVYGSKVKSI